jgi:DNA-binding NarL/FixJ family response regulator
MRKKLIVVADNSLIVEAIRSGLHESGAFELLGYTQAYNASARLVAGSAADLVLLDEADQSDRAITLIRSIKDREFSPSHRRNSPSLFPREVVSYFLRKKSELPLDGRSTRCGSDCNY